MWIENIIKNSSDYIQSKYSSATSNSEETEKSEHEDNGKYKEPLSNIQNDTIISTGLDVNNVGGYETRQNEQTVISTKHADIKKYMCFAQENATEIQGVRAIFFIRFYFNI